MVVNEELKPCVSVITPCYNGEKKIGRLIQSVINQTYDNIEFIIVNDGSTDNSAEIIETYRKKIENRGYSFKYIYQQNKGLGGAINSGLKAFSGEYLCWPDADDYLEPESVEHRVRFLIDHPEYAVVTSNAYVRKGDNLKDCHLLVKKSENKNLQKNQFALMLNGESIFCSGCHMVRVEAFLDVNPGREIYSARRGQNWQMLLPLYYKYKRYFLDEPLYNYIDYPDSMSKDSLTIESFFTRYEEHLTILKKTLEMIERIQQVNLKEYYCFVDDKYAKLKMNTAIRFEDKRLFEKVFLEKKKSIGLDKRDYLMYFQSKYVLVNKVVYFVHFIRKKLR